MAGGLLVNAAGHAAQSVVALAPVPGVIAGLLLVAPAAALVLARLDVTPGRAVAMPVGALTALQLADMLLWWDG